MRNGHKINGDSDHSAVEMTNGHKINGVEMTNGHKINGESAIRDVSKIPRRRLFILSANDKVALETQMSDLGTSQAFW